MPHMPILLIPSPYGYYHTPYALVQWHLRRLPGEDPQAIVARVAREIHQDVDAILVDQLGHLNIAA